MTLSYGAHGISLQLLRRAWYVHSTELTPLLAKFAPDCTQRTMCQSMPVGSVIDLVPKPTHTSCTTVFLQCALLANSAGIGGGPFYVPLLNVVVGFSLQECTGLSHTIVATSAIASTLYGLTHQRPDHPDRPLVDLDVALLFIPALLFGVSLGVICNNIVPEWLRVVLLTALLLFVVYKTAKKGKRQWEAEEKSRQQRTVVLADHDGQGTDDDDAASTKGGVLHEEDFVETKAGAGAGGHDVEAPRGSSQQEEGLLAVLKIVDWWKVVQLVLLWAVFLTFQMVKSKYGNCTKQYLVLFLAQTVFCITVTTFYMRRELADLGKPAAQQHGDPEVHQLLLGQRDGPSQSDRRPVKVLLAAVGILALAGATAGLLGIGGALIFNPYLLQLGMDPRVVASTSVLMILFSSSTIALSYLFNGMLNTHYALVFAPICFISSLVGVTVIGRLVRKTGRSSILIMILTALIAAGTFLSAIFGGSQAYDDIKHHHNVGFQPFCQ
ncbi:hypothetical protein ABBQ32_011825 [Trebouxia sp. C0010 RCD-2024]